LPDANKKAPGDKSGALALIEWKKYVTQNHGKDIKK